MDKEMRFIRIEEIQIRKLANKIKDASSNDDSIIYELEGYAIDMIEGYLIGRFDIDNIFSQKGSKRSPTLVRITIDMILCMLFERLNSNEMPIKLAERCENNTKWLEKVAAGKIPTNLPLLNPKFNSTTQMQMTSSPAFNNIDNTD